MPTEDKSSNSSVGTQEVLEFWPEEKPKPMKKSWPKMGTRQIIPIYPEGWKDFALSEWWLESAGWEDYHPHDETNFVVEGQLIIEAEGVRQVLNAGDTARVKAGHLGRYWAPEYARMIAIYGPNPDGLDSNQFRYWEI